MRIRVEVGLDSIELEDDGAYNPSVATELCDKAATLTARLLEQRDRHPQPAVLLDEDDE